jgi:hypothetical protein
MRKSGDSRALELACHRVRETGPLAALAEAGESIQDTSWRRTTALANLKLWKIAGDLLSPRSASRAGAFALASASDQPPVAMTRLNPTFVVALPSLDALTTLIWAADDELSYSIIGHLSSLPPDVDEVLVGPLTRLVRFYGSGRLDDNQRAALRRVADTSKSKQLVASAREVLWEAGDIESRDRLVEQARAGDFHSLSALKDMSALDIDGGRAILAIVEPRVRKIVDDAHHNTWSGYEFNYMALLALVNIQFPDEAQWDLLLDALRDHRLAANDKWGACEVLLHHAAEARANVAEVLSQSGDEFERGVSFGPLTPDRPLKVVVEHLRIAMGTYDEEERQRREVSLAIGDDKSRRELATILRSEASSVLAGTLAALAADHNSDVRGEAIAAATNRIVTGLGSIVERRVVASVGDADGISVPSGFLRGISGAEGSVDPDIFKVLEQLAAHPSAIVRRGAASHRERLSK